jgi:hypothetical protein
VAMTPANRLGVAWVLAGGYARPIKMLGIA